MSLEFLYNGKWFTRTSKQHNHAEMIKTHDKVSVAANGTNASAWFLSEGFDKIVLHTQNDAAVQLNAKIHWSHDTTNIHGQDHNVVAGTPLVQSGEVSVKAKYFRVELVNGDAAAHVISSQVYLKA